jgi:hypothetical protein
MEGTPDTLSGELRDKTTPPLCIADSGLAVRGKALDV